MTDQIIRSGDGTIIRVNQKNRQVEFRLSDDSLDRANSRIDPRGIETQNYAKNPIFLWGHDGYGGPFRGPPKMEHVIGRTVKWGVTRLNRAADAEKDRGYAFDITVEFAPADVNPEAERALLLVKGGFLNATSIGLSVLEWKMETAAGETRAPDVIVYTKTDLLEASLVAIPANPNAVALARIIAPGYDNPNMHPGDVAERITRWLHGHLGSAFEPPAQPAADPGSPDLATSILNHWRDRADRRSTVDLIKRAIGDRW